jgi:hypothetical protein
MALKVVEDTTNVTRTGAVITVESDLPLAEGYQEIDGYAVKVAMQYAAEKGLLKMAVSKTSNPFVVDEEGKPIEHIGPIPPNAKYRVRKRIELLPSMIQ